MALIQTEPKKNKLPKWTKVLGIIFAGIVLLLTIGYFIMSWYVKSHKQQLLASITEKISNNISGKFTIEDMEPAILQSFPDISVRLINIKLQDSLYTIYHKNTIDLQSIYIKLNFFSIFTTHPQIKKVTLSDGNIYLFKQKNEYSNVYLFQKKDSTKKKSDKGLEFHDFAIENVTFTFDNFLRNKQFKARFDKMSGIIHPNGDSWKINTITEAFIYQLGFNLDKGGYLVNSVLKGNLKMVLHTDNGLLHFPVQTITLDDIPIILKANFDLSKKPVIFDLDLNVKSINYTKGIHLLTRNISKKLDSISIKENIAAHALIRGTFAYPDTPFVNVFFEVSNNTINTTLGNIQKANFKAEFSNHIYPDKGKNDNNSAVAIPKFSGEWEGIPINADSVFVMGLTKPIIDLHLKSTFPIEKLNNVIGSAYSLKNGVANMDVTYHGPVNFKEAIDYNTKGFITIKNASLTYLPRNLKFKNANAHFLFQGKDLILDKIQLSSQNSSIEINGIVAHFLNTLFIDPSKAVFDWKIKSNSIDLNEFKSFLEPRKENQVSLATKNQKIKKLNNNLDNLLAKSTMLLDVDVQKVFYRRFSARSIKGKVTLSEKGINFQNVQLAHAGGTIIANGRVDQSLNQNPFQFKTSIKNVKIDQLFNAFENFGQSSITDKNIEGSFSANIEINGKLGEQLDFIQNSFDGKINFNLKNGQLNDFPPFVSISKFIFKNRNLDHITFENLQNNLILKNGKLTIPKMEIESSAIRMTVEGVYAFGTGTNIGLVIPLRNPDKDKSRVEKGLAPKKNKGIVVYLRAQDGKDGKVHIGWDPLKKGEKSNDDSLFSKGDLNQEDTIKLR